MGTIATSLVDDRVETPRRPPGKIDYFPTNGSALEPRAADFRRYGFFSSEYQ